MNLQSLTLSQQSLRSPASIISPLNEEGGGLLGEFLTTLQILYISTSKKASRFTATSWKSLNSHLEEYQVTSLFEMEQNSSTLKIRTLKVVSGTLKFFWSCWSRFGYAENFFRAPKVHPVHWKFSVGSKVVSSILEIFSRYQRLLLEH